MLLWLTASGRAIAHPRLGLETMNPKQNEKCQHRMYEHYILVAPTEKANWTTPPWHWLLHVMAAFKEQNPSRQVALLGISKGAWWGQLFLSTAPSP